MNIKTIPSKKEYNIPGGRPGCNVDFKAVCDAVLGARNGNEETVTEVTARFGVSRGDGCTSGCTRL